jgi:thiol-disulfide isomerase/thioredoxin
MYSTTNALIAIAFLIGIIMIIMCSSKSPFESMGTSEKPNISKQSVLIFFAPWCGYCQRSKADFEKAVKHGGGDIHMIDATNDENKKLCEKYQIKSFPTIIKADGTKYDGKTREADEIIAFKDRK